MDIDEFLDKEASNLGGKEQIQSKEGGGGRRDNENLLDQLETVKNQLKENKVDSALKEFDYLKSRYTDMTKKQLSENRYIFNELIRINQEIITKIDNQRAEFDKRKQMINKLLNDAYIRFNNGELQTAYKLYIEITEMLKNMTDLFYEEKNLLNYQITAFSVQLFPKIQKQTDQDFENKKNMILNEINKAYQYMQTNTAQLPPKTYDNINNLFQQLPEGHIYEKAILYNDILKLFRSTSLSGEVNSLVQEMLKQHQGFANSVLGQPQNQPAQAQQASQASAPTPDNKSFFGKVFNEDEGQQTSSATQQESVQPTQEQTQGYQQQPSQETAQTQGYQQQPSQETAQTQGYQQQPPIENTQPQAEQEQTNQIYNQFGPQQTQMDEPPTINTQGPQQAAAQQAQDYQTSEQAQPGQWQESEDNQTPQMQPNIEQSKTQQMDKPPEISESGAEDNKENGEKKGGLFSKLFNKKKGPEIPPPPPKKENQDPDTQEGGQHEFSLK